ncbi:hypothetical protein NMY22_g9560 [Coprinellus aureogranulatus]|nr:hypothetical protein NMY22_g9560 [Coprinellus aureogranulatus]
MSSMLTTTLTGTNTNNCAVAACLQRLHHLYISSAGEDGCTPDVDTEITGMDVDYLLPESESMGDQNNTQGCMHKGQALNGTEERTMLSPPHAQEVTADYLRALRILQLVPASPGCNSDRSCAVAVDAGTCASGRGLRSIDAMDMCCPPASVAETFADCWLYAADVGVFAWNHLWDPISVMLQILE